MIREAYLVLNEGNIVYASYDIEKAEGVLDNRLTNSLVEFVNGSGIDIEDLTPEELDKFAITSGYNGDRIYMSKVNIDDEVDDRITVTAVSMDGSDEDDFEICELKSLISNYAYYEDELEITSDET